jgi:hypothetical protein
MSKILCNFIRTLGVAALLAAAAMSLLAGAAHAKPKSPAQRLCEAQGFVWDDKKGCADSWCVDNKGQQQPPGDTYNEKGVSYMCNGWTGEYEKIGIEPALSGTGAPLTGGVASPAGAPSPVPTTMRPGGGVLSPR